jgi:hypothetical protein
MNNGDDELLERHEKYWRLNDGKKFEEAHARALSKIVSIAEKKGIAEISGRDNCERCDHSQLDHKSPSCRHCKLHKLHVPANHRCSKFSRNKWNSQHNAISRMELTSEKPSKKKSRAIWIFFALAVCGAAISVLKR